MIDRRRTNRAKGRGAEVGWSREDTEVLVRAAQDLFDGTQPRPVGTQ
jgi:hypothetical protein